MLSIQAYKAETHRFKTTSTISLAEPSGTVRITLAVWSNENVLLLLLLKYRTGITAMNVIKPNSSRVILVFSYMK